jgi:hypothetical protein
MIRVGESSERRGTSVASSPVMSASGELPVVMDDPERANLLELMLQSVLRRRLTDPRTIAHARALAGSVVVEAGEMRARLVFGSGQITITRGDDRGGAARVRGTLPAVIAAALGQQRVANVLRGRLRVNGHPRVLWHLLRLLQGGGG